MRFKKFDAQLALLFSSNRRASGTKMPLNVVLNETKKWIFKDFTPPPPPERRQKSLQNIAIWER